jgi:hypothetical protein
VEKYHKNDGEVYGGLTFENTIFGHRIGDRRSRKVHGKKSSNVSSDLGQKGDSIIWL